MARKTKKEFDKVVERVRNGDYKDGEDRIKALTEEGWNYADIQNRVNELEGSDKRYDPKDYEVDSILDEKGKVQEIEQDAKKAESQQDKEDVKEGTVPVNPEKKEESKTDTKESEEKKEPEVKTPDEKPNEKDAKADKVPSPADGKTSEDKIPDKGDSSKESEDFSFDDFKKDSKKFFDDKKKDEEEFINKNKPKAEEFFNDKKKQVDDFLHGNQQGNIEPNRPEIVPEGKKSMGIRPVVIPGLDKDGLIRPMDRNPVMPSTKKESDGKSEPDAGSKDKQDAFQSKGKSGTNFRHIAMGKNDVPKLKQDLQVIDAVNHLGGSFKAKDFDDVTKGEQSVSIRDVYKGAAEKLGIVDKKGNLNAERATALYEADMNDLDSNTQQTLRDIMVVNDACNSPRYKDSDSIFSSFRSDKAVSSDFSKMSPAKIIDTMTNNGLESNSGGDLVVSGSAMNIYKQRKDDMFGKLQNVMKDLEKGQPMDTGRAKNHAVFSDVIKDTQKAGKSLADSAKRIEETVVSKNKNGKVSREDAVERSKDLLEKIQGPNGPDKGLDLGPVV